MKEKKKIVEEKIQIEKKIENPKRNGHPSTRDWIIWMLQLLSFSIGEGFEFV